ncbi:MAG TPA: TM0106 family RecB-like putative nuclease, partial [Candidatus Eisenbacteria bacterium]|nr:TM0106 family RecB-like putative nuclease [Candidatus Eisenbacteria bacterium]
PGRGLACLPAPAAADVFVDLEGDPYFDEGGIEYLFGWAVADPAPAGMLALDAGAPAYHSRWALDRGAERRGFEALIDTIMARWDADPNMHVYHFGAYEPGSFKRLMGRYATRETEVDRLLRGARFVDLHDVVKQSLRASVEEYSIKKLEPLYAFERGQPLPIASASLRVIERSLELGHPIDVAGEHARIVEEYNRDDCISAKALRDWLETLRTAAIEAGAEIPRPSFAEDKASDAVSEREKAAQALAERLLAGVPEGREERSDEQHARWLLAHLLEWHRREDKAPWWQYFKLRGMSDEELLDQMPALAGLEYVGRVGKEKSLPIDRYRFPAQETSIREESELELPGPEGGSFGEVTAIDFDERTVDIKKKRKCIDVHPTSVFAHKVIGSTTQADALMRLGEWVATNGVDAPGGWRAARDLLLRLTPRVKGHTGEALEAPGEGGVKAARRLAVALDHGTLAIQGPPGSGKTFTGARMILDLARSGKRVGVCGFSHKVIRNLLQGVVAAAAEQGKPIDCIAKVRTKSQDPDPSIVETTDNAVVLDTLKNGPARIAGGTSWLWAREEFFEAVDVLFVDEAGQMSLANVLAIAGAGKNLVLLGDPRQLEQPIQGSHPEGTEVSALDHVIGKHLTIPPDRGLFLAESWRLPPEICSFTSEMFYEGKLHARSAPELQALAGSDRFNGAGLWYVPVEHDANQSSCAEEVEAVEALVAKLLAGGMTWRDRDGATHDLGLDDILVIAPYNAQVADLKAKLPKGARIGTVDKFQGQEAPVVIYSLTSSTPQDAPRGMDFLYDSNRFNVATSRAMCACIVVGSPLLFEPDCQSPKQVKLANAFCRFLEVAREVRSGPTAELLPTQS